MSPPRLSHDAPHRKLAISRTNGQAAVRCYGSVPVTYGVLSRSLGEVAPCNDSVIVVIIINDAKGVSGSDRDIACPTYSGYVDCESRQVRDGRDDATILPVEP